MHAGGCVFMPMVAPIRAKVNQEPSVSIIVRCNMIETD
jgi:hypothetical protein